MGQNIGTGGRAWGRILGRCVEYTGVGQLQLKVELGFRQKINFEFRMIYFGYISEEPQFR